ncbi:hypothetical protein FQR65_LT15711 [Abscondita terminalis]|nr:hypothetical protein FQR65_LT15711 [Abscondita terminalis]
MLPVKMPNNATSTDNLNFNQQTSSKSVAIRSSDDILFQTLIRDPIKKAFLLNLLSSEKENIRKYKREQQNTNTTPVSKRRRLHCESPTALLRRKALEKNVEQQSSPSTSCSPSTPVQFDKLLQGVVAYVEIRSKGVDRSAGAKALMQSMGAKVVEKLERGVTHVVFKDSTFATYQKAKLLKAHLVSVLWLEAVRKNNHRVSEKNYPALGMEAYDVNVSEIFQEYETVVDEEYRRSMAVGTARNTIESQRKRRLTSLPSELASYCQRSCPSTPTNSRRMSNFIIPSSQDFEAESIISSRGILTSRTGSEISAVEEFTSDDDSHCGVINGESFSQLKQSLLCNLETQLNNYDDRVNNDTEHSSNQNSENDHNNQSTKNNQSNIVKAQNDISINNDQTVSTSSSRSASLLSRKSIVSEKTINVTADMDLTRNITSNVQDQNLKTKTLPFGDESIPNLLNGNKLISQPMQNNYNDKPPLFNIVVTDTSPPRTQRFSIPANRNSKPMRISSGLSSSQTGTRKSNTQSTTSPQTIVPSTFRISPGTGSNSVGIRKSIRISKSIAQPQAKKNEELLPKTTNGSPLKLGTDNKKSLQKEPRNGSGEQPKTPCVKTTGEFGKSTRLSKPNSGVPNASKTAVNQNNEVKKRAKYTRITKPNIEDSSSDDELVKNSKQINNGGVRRSARISNLPFINNIELTDDSSENNLARSTDSDTRSRSDSSKNMSSRGINLQAPNTSPQSKSIQESSSDDTSNNTVPPVNGERDLSKNSENMPSLRISADSAGKRVSSSEPKENNFACLTKNSENMPSLRISAASAGKRVSSSEAKENNSACLTKNSENMPFLRISADSAGKRVSSSEAKENNFACLTKNSENMPSLRISADSAGTRVSSSEPKENSSENALRRSSRKSACLSKNSEPMPPLRLSLESPGKRTQPTRKSTRLNRSDPKTSNNSSPKENETKRANISPNNKPKKMRKLYNINQTPSQVRELASENVDVDPIPVPLLNPNAKTLIVSLTQLVLPEGGKKILKKKNFRKTKRNAAALTQSSPTVETVENRLVDEDGTNPKRIRRLSIENVAPQTTQLMVSESRRSTLEFVENTAPKKKIPFLKRTLTSIVCTRMHKPEAQRFLDAVRKLGKFFVENDVTEKTTHLVVGECKRTVNLLKAISRGCWILRKDWLFKSIDDGKWAQEEDYELTDFSPAVKVCRTERQAFGNLYSMDIFNDCDPIYVSVNSNPKRVDLIELIKLCKGRVVTKRNDAKIVVAEYVDADDVKCVNEKWILDSITFNKKKSLKKYLIRSGR